MNEPVDTVNAAAVAAGQTEGPAAAYRIFSENFVRFLRAGDGPTAVRILHREALFAVAQQDLELAIDLAIAALEVSRAGAFSRHIPRALNLLGFLYYQRHDWDEAQGWYERALVAAEEAHADALTATISANLGALFNIRGDLREAKGFYLDSIGAAVRAAARPDLVRAYNNLGMVCSDLKEWMEAIVYFDRGVEIAEQIGDIDLLAILHVNRAEPMIQVGDWLFAARSLDQAESLGRRRENRAVLSDVERMRGRLARRTGSLEEADRHLRTSLRLSIANGLKLHQAEAWEERGLVRTDRSEYRAALHCFRRARELFGELDAERDVERIDAQILHAREESAHRS